MASASKAIVRCPDCLGFGTHLNEFPNSVPADFALTCNTPREQWREITWEDQPVFQYRLFQSLAKYNQRVGRLAWNYIVKELDRRDYIPELTPELRKRMHDAYHSSIPVWDEVSQCSKHTGLEAVYRVMVDAFLRF